MEEASKIKKLALKSLKGKWKDAFLLTFIFSFIVFAIYLLEYFSQFNDIIYLIVALFVFVITIPLNYGFTAAIYKLKKNNSISYFDSIKFAFKNFRKSWSIFGNTILKILPLFIIFFLVSLILAIGSTIIADSNIYISDISSISNLNQIEKIGVILSIAGLIGYLICLILLVPQFLKYSLTFFIALDNPNLSSKKIVKESAKLMKNKKWSLFKIFISFIFWAIVALIPYSIFIDIFSLPILGLAAFLISYSLLIPYIIFTFIEYYESIKLENLETEKH